jgi:hypothetical protein
MATCPDCKVELPQDAAVCSGCGAPRGSVRVLLPTATAHAEVGDIRVLVEQASAELAALPAAAAQAVLAQAVQLSGSLAGKGAITGALRVTQPVGPPVAPVAGSAGIEEAAAASDAYAAELEGKTPALLALVKVDRGLQQFLLNAASNAVGGVVSGLTVAAVLAWLQPQKPVEVHYHFPRAPAAQCEPARPEAPPAKKPVGKAPKKPRTPPHKRHKGSRR